MSGPGQKRKWPRYAHYTSKDDLKRTKSARAAFAINYDGNPGQDGRPAGPALQV
jgi:hypothetical protein